MMDGRHIGILLPISIFTYSLCIIIRMSFILHPPAKFRRNRKKNIGGLLTSYRFFKMAVMESEIYF